MYGWYHYQITAINEFSRGRILTIVKDKTSLETAKFLRGLEKAFIQSGNGR
ncbi:MAG: hypothetical protein GX978_06830 [Tissierellia bacterium]|nr:hypothetical protein [Tissierellia bacterium]